MVEILFDCQWLISQELWSNLFLDNW